MVLLRGGVLRIILKDAIPGPVMSCEDAQGGGWRNTGTSSDVDMDIALDRSTRTETNRTGNPTPGTGAPEYFIYKALLLSVAPELYKYTDNLMRGAGRESVIELSEVDEPTIEAFLEWAYYQNYSE